jgi:hypothetical protein
MSDFTGQKFQAQCRSPESRAAMTVYQKYRRKFKLEHEHLLELQGFLYQLTIEGVLPLSEGFLIQRAVAHCKENWGSRV